MARFRFRLQSLLQLRDADRQQRLGELAESLASERMCQQARRAVDGQRTTQRNAARHAAGRVTVDVDRLQAASEYDASLRERAAELARKQHELDAEIAERQRALAVADGHVRVLEKLRERQLQDFARQQVLAEINELDEAALRAYARD
jgi:flagellar export protein FliJ